MVMSTLLQSGAPPHGQEDQGVRRVRLHRQEPETPALRNGGDGGGGGRALAHQELQEVQGGGDSIDYFVPTIILKTFKNSLQNAIFPHYVH